MMLRACLRRNRTAGHSPALPRAPSCASLDSGSGVGSPRNLTRFRTNAWRETATSTVTAGPYPRARLSRAAVSESCLLSARCRSDTSRICIGVQFVRTTLNIDDAALAAALDLAPGKTKMAIINDALREFVRRRRLRGLRLFAGKVRWEGNLDPLRKRRSHAS